MFGQMLGLCNRGRDLSSELVALDSTKIKADATCHRNLTHRQIAQQILADAAGIDAEERARHGSARGDEMPAHLANPAKRKAWIRERLNGSEKSKPADRNGTLRGVVLVDR